MPELVADEKMQVGKAEFKAMSLLAKPRCVSTITMTTTRDLQTQIICSLTKDFFAKLSEATHPLCRSFSRLAGDEISCHEYDLEL